MPGRSLKLRVIDFGSQVPLRSQTLWHAIAYGVSEGAPPTLSFVTPSAPYVSIGYHRSLDEIDIHACRSRGLEVFRRMVGGGPVYLDPDQLFFQIAMPVGSVPAFGPRAMVYLLDPAVQAFRDVGIEAVFDERGDISMGDVKISGIAGGQIESCALAVGNLVQRFDYDAMAAVLGIEEGPFAEEVLRLMREFFQPTPADDDAFKAALINRYAETFGLEPGMGLMSGHELDRLTELDERFVSPSWVRGPDRPARGARRVKIRSGVWVFAAHHHATKVIGSVIDGRLKRLFVDDPEANGEAAKIEAALTDVSFQEVADAARCFGSPGYRVAAALTNTEGREP